MHLRKVLVAGFFGLGSYKSTRSMSTQLHNTSGRTMDSLNNKTVLITGANRGLGKLISQKMAAQGWVVYATARDAKAMAAAFEKEGLRCSQYMDFDLCETPNPERIDQLFAALPQTIDAVVHCASPYMKTPLLETSSEEIEAFSNAMQNDILFSKAAASKLRTSSNPNPVLAITGAVIGLPDFYALGMMGLLKNNQRQLAGVLAHELEQAKASVSVRHFDLGAFRDEVLDPDKEISTEFVATTIIDALNNPSEYPLNIHLLPKENEQDFGVKATRAPEEAKTSSMSASRM